MSTEQSVTPLPEIEIKRDPYDTSRRCVKVYGRNVEALCVDGKEYRRNFPSKGAAEHAAHGLIAIVPAWGWREIR